MNLFVVKKAAGAILIDAGLNPIAVGAELKQLGIEPGQVAAVF